MTDFKAAHIERTAAITLQAPPEEVFPLFGPVREAEWADGWAPVIRYAARPDAFEQGAVFTSSHPGEPDTIWLIMALDHDAHLIRYARITPGVRAGEVRVQCQPGSTPGTTRATVTYIYTALSEAGNELLAEFTGDHYQHWLAHWEQAINHYLATGSLLA